MPAEFLCNLPKNLTTHLTHKLYSAFPKVIFGDLLMWKGDEKSWELWA
jgi:hypothetical protein